MTDIAHTTAILPLITPATFLVAGMSGCGKSTLIRRLLENPTSFDQGFDKVLLCYGVYQELYTEMERTIPGLVLHEGLPSQDTLDNFTDIRQHRICIIDDLSHEALNSQLVQLMFTRFSHHANLSTVLISQNIFEQGTKKSTITANVGYVILLKSPRAACQLGILSSQIYPGQKEGVLAAYKDAVQNYGYFVLDCMPHSNDLYRLRSCILPGELPVIYRLK